MLHVVVRLTKVVLHHGGCQSTQRQRRIYGRRFGARRMLRSDFIFRANKIRSFYDGHAVMPGLLIQLRTRLTSGPSARCSGADRCFNSLYRQEIRADEKSHARYISIHGVQVLIDYAANVVVVKHGGTNQGIAIPVASIMNKL